MSVLFDLDGTLVDTAPDLLGALDDLRVELRLAPLATPLPAAIAARGGRGILTLGLPEFDGAADNLLPRYLDIYAARLARESRAYPGVEAMLDELAARGRKCAIVTNKPEALARALIAALGWSSRFAALVGGDTLALRKPAPDPIWHACKIAGIDVASATMVGDDARDVQAGKSAGCGRTIACAYGYVETPGDVPGWGADAIASRSSDVLELL